MDRPVRSPLVRNRLGRVLVPLACLVELGSLRDDLRGSALLGGRCRDRPVRACDDRVGRRDRQRGPSGDLVDGHGEGRLRRPAGAGSDQGSGASRLYALNVSPRRSHSRRRTCPEIPFTAAAGRHRLRIPSHHEPRSSYSPPRRRCLGGCPVGGCTGDWETSGKSVLFLGNSFTDYNGASTRCSRRSRLAHMPPASHLVAARSSSIPSARMMPGRSRRGRGTSSCCRTRASTPSWSRACSRPAPRRRSSRSGR